jgi:hypothetical protein
MIKTKMLVGAAAAALMLSTSLLPAGPFSAAPAQAQSASVSFSLFFEELAPHGVWVRHAQYRNVFCPTGVDRRWRPYTEGRWVYLADYGWYFQSEEPFAWATYHYGRWLDDEELGWCWVPGTQWAPAWVSWRRGDDIVGWAPLPPEGDGYVISASISRQDLPEDYWVFVPTQRFIEPNLSVSIVFGSDEPDYYSRTEFLGPVVVEGDVVVNNVLEVNYIEQQINQEVTVYNVQEASDPTTVNATAEGDTIQIFNQAVAEPTEETAPAEAVEASEAVQVIQAEGGTAGAEAEAGAGAETEAGAGAETGATTEETTAPEAAPTGEATTEEAAPAATETTQDEAAPAAGDATEQTAPAEENATQQEAAPADAEATAEEEAAPAATEEAAPAAADTATDAATEGEAAPAGAVTQEETAPATEEAAPAEEAAPEEVSCAAGEELVDGACVPADAGDAGAETATEAPATEEAPADAVVAQ